MAGLLLSTAFFLLFQLCGCCVSRAALSKENGEVKLLFGSVLGSMMLQWFPVPFAFFLGFSTAAHICAAILAVLCAGLAVLFRWKAGGRIDLFDILSAFRRKKFLWVVSLVLILFCALVWRSFRWENGRIFSSQATYGDMSMHLSFLTSIARQGTFPPEYSLLPGFLLSYPFLGDSISSSLYLLGASLKWAYTLPMFFAGAQVLFGGYFLLSRLLRSSKKGALAWCFFFLNGGFGFLYFLGSKEDFFRIFTDFYQTPTNYVEGNIRWVNVMVDMMLPQRATLFGWAVLFSTLYLLVRAVFEKEKRYFLYVGILAGLLPMIHTHSFVALALCCGVWLLCALLRELSWEHPATQAGKGICLTVLALFCLIQYFAKEMDQMESEVLLWTAVSLAGIFLLFLLFLLWRAVRQGAGKELLTTWGVLLLAACVLALPQLCFWTFRQASTGGFIRGHFGWVIGRDNYLWFYLKNVGLAGVLALGGMLLAKGKNFLKYAPALVIWILSELVVFQPNAYDNNKLLYVAYLFLCCPAAEFLCFLLEKLKHRGIQGILIAATVAVCSFSALLTVGREWNARYEIFGDGAIALSQYAEENIPADALILTNTRHNNEIAALAGRNILCGSPSYLYFHGLPYPKWEHVAQLMYQQPEENRNAFREYGVDYVLVSDFERSTYEVDELWFMRNFTKLYDDGVRVLYQVKD
ncbi:MAG: hypothetical protein J1E06_02510 [Acutalibacter sp.]|nr:hypothetical protein [Acutalibacter sp.]